jgi:hypothetical protein
MKSVSVSMTLQPMAIWSIQLSLKQMMRQALAARDLL